MAKQIAPLGIARRPHGVEFRWEEGHQGFFPARDLRLRCPCARCIDEMSGRPILDPASVPADVAPDRLELVGGYALRIVWSDGHSSGIYPFEMLRSLCPCAACRGS